MQRALASAASRRTDAQFDSGWAELMSAFRRHHLWLWFGLLDIRMRYRRVVLGPWWVSMSTAMMVGALALLYSRIFQLEVASYLPHLAIGMVVWTLISTQISDAANAFIGFAHAIHQVRIPLPAYLLRILVRNLLMLAHNSVIVLLALIISGTHLSPATLLVVPGLLLVCATLFGLSLALAILCTRYRDLQQVVVVLLQLLFLVTPILWKPESLGADAWLASINPLFHLIEMVRMPTLGMAPPAASAAAALGLCAAANLLAVWLFTRYHRKIVYWL